VFRFARWREELLSSSLCYCSLWLLLVSVSEWFYDEIKCVDTQLMSCTRDWREKLLITTYQEVNDQLWSNTCCDDENERSSGNTGLPEQHFQSKLTEIKPSELCCYYASFYATRGKSDRDVRRIFTRRHMTIELDGKRRREREREILCFHFNFS
jgi:hypothetical protein